MVRSPMGRIARTAYAYRRFRGWRSATWFVDTSDVDSNAPSEHLGLIACGSGVQVAAGGGERPMAHRGLDRHEVHAWHEPQRRAVLPCDVNRAELVHILDRAAGSRLEPRVGVSGADQLDPIADVHGSPVLVVGFGRDLQGDRQQSVVIPGFAYRPGPRTHPRACCPPASVSAPQRP